MKYSYYPGCSSHASGRGLGTSVPAVAAALNMELVELENWTCCGSTPYGSIDEIESIVVAAHNLALAEKTGITDMVTPCSSCFVVTYKANEHLKAHPHLAAQVNQALAAAGLSYQGKVRVRQLAEVLYNDITPDGIKSKVQKPLIGLKVASYYGCQMLRPYGFENAENPQSLDKIAESVGATAVPFPLKNRCCGGSLIIPEEAMALALIRKILQNAADNGAECIITPCPLCQTNLDAYQGRVNSTFHTHFKIPILYVTQLIGLALGINPATLGLDTNVISPKAVLDRLNRVKQEVSSGT